ncbi:MAG: HDIG domain-containing protein [Bacteroidaceae bacterium]|nr:HDIG domain-containing protein [Bacteroidaceae bacterium]
MKQNKQHRRLFITGILMKAMLVIVSTVLIVYFMQLDNDFGYRYELNKPWEYDQLISNTKFPIIKNDSAMSAERDSLIRRFQPYYIQDREIGDSLTNQFRSYGSKAWNGQNADIYTHYIASMLDSVYKHGVLSVVEYGNVKDAGRRSVRVVKGNQALITPLGSVYSTSQAYEYIMRADTSKYSRLILQMYNIQEFIKPNLSYDEEKSQAELNDVLKEVVNSSGIVHRGEKIVDRGEIVTQEIYDKLNSYQIQCDKNKDKTTEIPYRLIGETVFVLVIFISLISYLTLFRADYFDNYRSGILLFALPVFFCIIASLMVSHNMLNVFMLPCCMVPIIIRVFMDSRTAFMFHCGMVLIMSLQLNMQYEFIIVQLAAGIVCIQSLRELSERSQIIRTAFLIFLVYVVSYTAYYIYHENSVKMDLWIYVWFSINGVLLLFTYPLLWMFEKVFGFVSDVTLVELSNISNPLLQRMSEVAPGTFQHSMQVANLSAEVANKIGAKPQLVRTGALYHDIGKTERPVFFTENQKGLSPHRHLSALKSAEVIIAHVTNGINLAEKNHLPELIIRFIKTHHGYGKAKYFYITYKNEHPDEEVDESLFTYPGPNPSTKEEAILMMCDGVEAASRSLSEYTEESIDGLVDKIIDGQVAEGFFSESSVTFKDIAVAKSVLKEKLKTIYHTRISYPELNIKEVSGN